MAGTGVVVLVHGSRGRRGKVEVEEALRQIVARLKPVLASAVEIVGAALQFNQPSLEEAVGYLASRQIDCVVIVPYFLFSGRHITEHVPQAIGDLQHTYPDIRFLLADNLGLDDHFVSLLATRVRQVAPDLAVRPISSKGKHIESESMKIVDSLYHSPSDMLAEEAAVIKRIIHASGDIEIVNLIKFSPLAVSSGVRAVAAGRPIITDVRMVAAGIDGHLAATFGCSIYCALDAADILNWSQESALTRSAAAMNCLGRKLDDAIVAIGNAPTALLALLKLIAEGKVKPALIVGMPVGFVKAAESKQELMKCGTPYFTVSGTRGGSAMAAATVNALLRITSDGRSPHDGFEKEEHPIC